VIAITQRYNFPRDSQPSISRALTQFHISTRKAHAHIVDIAEFVFRITAVREIRVLHVRSVCERWQTVIAMIFAECQWRSLRFHSPSRRLRGNLHLSPTGATRKRAIVQQPQLSSAASATAVWLIRAETALQHLRRARRRVSRV